MSHDYKTTNVAVSNMFYMLHVHNFRDASVNMLAPLTQAKQISVQTQKRKAAAAFLDSSTGEAASPLYTSGTTS